MMCCFKKFHLPIHELVLFPNDTNSSHACEIPRSFKKFQRRKGYLCKLPDIPLLRVNNVLSQSNENSGVVLDFQIPINLLLGILWINYLLYCLMYNMYEKRYQLVS